MTATERVPVRVIHVITRLVLGGAQENTLLTLEGLQSIPDYRVTLVTGPAPGNEGNLFDHARRSGIQTVIIPELQRAVHPLRDLTAFLKLLSFFLREKPRIVHTHSAKAGILGRIAAKFAGVPIVLHTVHGLPFLPGQSRLARGLTLWAEQIASLCCSGFIAVGEVVKRQAISLRLARDVRVVYSGMDVDRFLNPPPGEEARRRLALPQGVPVIGVVSRLAAGKGHADLIRAATKLKAVHPDLLLLFVGDGELRTSLERAAAESSVQVRFAGSLPPEEIPACLAAMDVLAHPSYREGLPRSVPQALIAGRPVAAYDVDGAGECVLDGVTGRLVPPGDADALAAALHDLLSRPDRGRSLAEEGRRRFTERFRKERMVEAIHALYRDRRGARALA